MKRLTEDKTQKPNESTSESEESIHHIKEVGTIEEKKKHYTATIRMKGVKKEFIIDTGSPIPIMPSDERIMQHTEIQKKNQPVPRRKLKRNKNPEENTGGHRVRKQQTEDGNSDNRKNRYNTITRDGLDENIRANYRKNKTGREQPIRKRENRKGENYK